MSMSDLVAFLEINGFLGHGTQGLGSTASV